MSKSKLAKVKTEPESSDSDEEHDLTHYIPTRIKLMQEVFKILKPKKLATMAPDCVKDKSLTDLKAMLLEELLGISHKRLGRIFNGENLDQSSSSDSELDKKKDTDVISLDDITEDETNLSDEVFMEINLSKREQTEIEKIKNKSQTNPNVTGKVKKEKHKRAKKKIKKEAPEQEDSVMSVLNLLELQARARAIRSQLELEKTMEPNEKAATSKMKSIAESPSSVILIGSPRTSPVLVDNSDTDNEKGPGVVRIKQEKQSPIPERTQDEKSETNDDDILIVTENQEICE